MIAFEAVSRAFGPKMVLNNMTLAMADKGITCLLGVSGCGKSTAMRVASGLIAPDAGKVFINSGECGVVFQDTRLLPWLTTEENLTLAIAPEQRKKASEEIDHALRLVSLNPANVTRLFPRELSGGMAQRVGIARALLRKPRFLMMDEPFAALDAMTRSDLQTMLKELVEQEGICALFVTHDIEESFNIAERILVMASGTICEIFEKDAFDKWEKREKALDDILVCLDRKKRSKENA